MFILSILTPSLCDFAQPLQTQPAGQLQYFIESFRLLVANNN